MTVAWHRMGRRSCYRRRWWRLPVAASLGAALLLLCIALRALRPGKCMALGPDSGAIRHLLLFGAGICHGSWRKTCSLHSP